MAFKLDSSDVRYVILNPFVHSSGDRPGGAANNKTMKRRGEEQNESP